MTIRPPYVVLLAVTALLGLALAGAPTPAHAGGKKGGGGGGASFGYSGGGGGSYGRGGGGGGSHYRHYRSRSSPEPGTKRRAYSSRSHRSHRSHRYYRPYRFRGAYGYGYGYRRYPWTWSWGRSYQPYYGYSRYTYIEPTPTYYYSPQYYGYYPGRTYYEASLERKVHRLQSKLASERYARYYWRGSPPYYRPQGPSAEGACLYGPNEELLFKPQGKTCSSSLASR